jgi:hypothetical protein
MAQKKNLLKIDYHYDDETGMYTVGELDFGISAELPQYIKRYGGDGKDRILAMLGYLAWEVQETYRELQTETCNGRQHIPCRTPTPDGDNAMSSKESALIWHQADKDLPPPDQEDRLIRYVTGDYDIGYWADPMWKCVRMGTVYQSDGVVAEWADPTKPARETTTSC